MNFKTTIVLLFCLGMAITAFNKIEERKEAMASKPENKRSGHSQKLTDGAKGSQEVKSDQSVNTYIILGVLQDYSAERMEQAISLTFDEALLNEKTSLEIFTELSALINELKHAELVEVVNERISFASLKLKKDDHEYLLNLYFTDHSQKIYKMEFTRLN